MSTAADATVRELMLVMLRLVGRAKRMPPPEQLREFDLAPRHLSLLSLLVLDGAMTVSELAGKLGVAPTTVSLLVGDLSRKGVLERREDDTDRVHITLAADVRPPRPRAFVTSAACGVCSADVLDLSLLAHSAPHTPGWTVPADVLAAL